jgi:hypothetical protein
MFSMEGRIEMREILIVLRVPDVDEVDYEDHFPQDGDTLLRIETTVRRGDCTYQASHPRDRAAILSFDQLTEYVSKVLAAVEKARGNAG